jgi:hypothetical protein
MTTNDLILSVTGGPTINDGLAIWYSKTASETLNDAEYRYLIGLGATAASLNDMWYQVLRVKGFTGSLNDMLYAFWLGGGV